MKGVEIDREWKEQSEEEGERGGMINAKTEVE